MRESIYQADSLVDRELERMLQRIDERKKDLTDEQISEALHGFDLVDAWHDFINEGS